MSKNDDRASRPRAVPPRVSIALGVSCTLLVSTIAVSAVLRVGAHSSTVVVVGVVQRCQRASLVRRSSNCCNSTRSGRSVWRRVRGLPKATLH